MILPHDLPAARKLIHTLPPENVYAAFGTRPEGLTQAEVQDRLRQVGANTIRELPGTPILFKFMANFTHLMAILLWIGGLAALVAQLPQLAIAIWMVNVINGTFSFWQEYRAEKATEALRRMLPNYSRVIRDGTEHRVLAEELVPGDLLLVTEGDRISADARLIHHAELRVDQSTLTGESQPVPKSELISPLPEHSPADLPNFIFAGTTVTTGTGTAIVTATGMDTEFGKIASLTQRMGEELSPLQKEMAVATKVVTLFALIVGLFFFLLSVAFVHIGPAESFIFALGMIVAFVPEGMLPTVTLSLAMAVQRMAHRNALIKRMSAVETLGCTTVICTDKTGTLTQNEMTVTALWFGDHHFSVIGVGYDPNTGSILSDRAQSTDEDEVADLRSIVLAAALCNNAHIISPNGASPNWTILGDPTEAALKVLAVKAGLNPEVEAQQTPRVIEFPFDLSRKRMSTIHRLPATNGNVVFTKGAPQELLNFCTDIRVDERDIPLDDNWKIKISNATDSYARSGLRILAVARRELPAIAQSSVQDAAAVECNLTFLGLVAMMDPPRPEVKSAVETCHTAGIQMILITGDYGLTAESIARQIGIVRSANPHIIAGRELEAMSSEQLKEALRGEVIFARATPEHKLRVVTALQEMGEVVAVTGDGVNDAPALKKADIGVAMGMTGTDVAKEAADMILADDNFASIVSAIEEGRAVYSNIRKFITYIFTSNMPEAVPFILFALSGGRIPLALTIMQVLCIDLGTDMVPALALGAEPPEPDIMKRAPRNLKDHVITPALLFRAYGWLGLIESVAAMSAFYFMYWINGYWGQWIDLPSTGWLYQSATAMTLGAVVATQIGNLFVQRAEHTSIFRIGLFGNRLIWVGIASELVLVFMIIYIPFLQGIFDTAAFPLQNWLFLFAWTPTLIALDELRKAVRPRKRHMRSITEQHQVAQH